MGPECIPRGARRKIEIKKYFLDTRSKFCAPANEVLQCSIYTLYTNPTFYNLTPIFSPKRAMSALICLLLHARYISTKRC